jgi:DNA polymerase delta subunit 2
MVLSELAACLPVDLMPGEEDPINVGLPQQPFHGALLPGRDVSVLE